MVTSKPQVFVKPGFKLDHPPAQQNDLHKKKTDTFHLYYCLPPDTIGELVNHLCIETAIGIYVSKQHRKGLKSKKMNLNKGKTKALWTTRFKQDSMRLEGPLKTEQNITNVTLYFPVCKMICYYYCSLCLCVCDKIINWKKTRGIFSVEETVSQWPNIL